MDRRLILRALTLSAWFGSWFEIFIQKHMTANLGRLIPAVILCLLGFIVFWISTRHIKNKNFLVISNIEKPDLHLITGPYRFIRHPFYTSYILCYVSASLVIDALWLQGIILSLIGFYVESARREENNFLDSSFSDSYKAYRKKTGMFFPKIFKS